MPGTPNPTPTQCRHGAAFAEWSGSLYSTGKYTIFVPLRDRVCSAMRRFKKWGRMIEKIASHPKSIIPTQTNPPVQRRELHRSRRFHRKPKKHIFRLRVQQIIRLHRPAVRAMIGKVPLLGILAAPLSVAGPPLD